MARGFAIHNAPTDHGGIIPATQMRSSQMGNLFVVVGDGHFCPKCECWSKVLKSHDHVLFDGKAVAYAGDKLSCGARILPQQSHVVGDSGSSYGGSAISSFSPSNTQQNNNFMEDINKKYAIELIDLEEMPFVPLGAGSLSGRSNSKYQDSIYIHGKVQRGVFDSISLEVKKEGSYIEVARLKGAFKVGKTIDFMWDGFINDVYDSALMTNVQGVDFKIKAFNGGTEACHAKKNFIFNYINKDWLDVRINRVSKKVFVSLRVHFVDGGATDLVNTHMIPPSRYVNNTLPYNSQTRSFTQLKQLALQGINYYWSRNNSHPTGKNILIGNTQYEVFVSSKISTIQAMPKMKLTFITNTDPNSILNRSSNSALSRKTAYMTGYLKFGLKWVFYNYNYSDKKFKQTIAHETGHAIVDAYSGLMDSITHHGSSTTVTQNPNPGTTYPRTGEIDLMKYADEELSIIPTWDTRIVANSKDVTGLLLISGISKK